MIKPFLFLASLLVFMVFSIGLHTILFPYKKTSQSILTLSTLTHMAFLSYSIGYNETPFNTTYPEMQSLGRMDFVYDK